MTTMKKGLSLEKKRREKRNRKRRTRPEKRKLLELVEDLRYLQLS